MAKGSFCRSKHRMAELVLRDDCTDGTNLRGVAESRARPMRLKTARPSGYRQACEGCHKQDALSRSVGCRQAGTASIAPNSATANLAFVASRRVSRQKQQRSGGFRLGVAVGLVVKCLAATIDCEHASRGCDQSHCARGAVKRHQARRARRVHVPAGTVQPEYKRQAASSHRNRLPNRGEEGLWHRCLHKRPLWPFECHGDTAAITQKRCTSLCASVQHL
eukprot:1371324-Prymnesium_polylepis.1